MSGDCSLLLGSGARRSNNSPHHAVRTNVSRRPRSVGRKQSHGSIAKWTVFARGSMSHGAWLFGSSQPHHEMNWWCPLGFAWKPICFPDSPTQRFWGKSMTWSLWVGDERGLEPARSAVCREVAGSLLPARRVDSYSCRFFVQLQKRLPPFWINQNPRICGWLPIVQPDVCAVDLAMRCQPCARPTS